MKKVRLVVLAALPFISYALLGRFLRLWAPLAIALSVVCGFLFWRAGVAARRSGQVSYRPALFLTLPTLMHLGALAAAFFIDVPIFYWITAFIVALLFLVFHKTIGALASGSVAARDNFLHGQIMLGTAALFLFSFAAISAMSFLRISAFWVTLFLLAIFMVCTSTVAGTVAGSAGVSRSRLWIIIGGVVMIEWVWTLLFMPFTALSAAGCLAIIAAAFLVLESYALRALEISHRRIIFFTAIFIIAMVGILLATRWL